MALPLFVCDHSSKFIRIELLTDPGCSVRPGTACLRSFWPWLISLFVGDHSTTKSTVSISLLKTQQTIYPWLAKKLLLYMIYKALTVCAVLYKTLYWSVLSLLLLKVSKQPGYPCGIILYREVRMRHKTSCYPIVCRKSRRYASKTVITTHNIDHLLPSNSFLKLIFPGTSSAFT